MWRPSYFYLSDENFLKEIDNLLVKEQHLRLTALTWNEENPIGEIQGYATGGTINLNGSSAVRRSGSLTMIADSSNYKILNVNNIISINKKIAVEVGYTNTTDKFINDGIIWFPLGVYIIKNATISHGTNGLTISVQLSDKMCLLNGDVGGTFPATVNFSEVNVVNYLGETTGKEYPLLKNIIRSLVNEYGGIQQGQIIVDNIDDQVRNLVKWNGDQDLYKITIGSNIEFSLTEIDTDNIEVVQKGDPIGYIMRDFIWPGSQPLQGNAGESVVTVLDKISKALGNFEFFFDVYGTFIFQEIKNYLNTKISAKDLSESDYLINRSGSKTVYDFTNANLITSFQNTPQYANIKNDFIIWGSKKTTFGSIPIRYHLSINTKPAITENETPILMEFYEGPYGNQVKSVEGRYEIVTTLPSSTNIVKKEDYFYITSSGIYSPKFFPNEDQSWQLVKWLNPKLVYIKPTDWRTKLYLEGINNRDTSYYANRYGKELEIEWPKIYNIMAQTVGTKNGIQIYTGAFYEELNQNDYTYFLDFIEGNPEDSQIQDISVQNIGVRSKVLNQNGVNCIFAPEIPNLMLIESGKEDTDEKIFYATANGYKYSQVSSDIFKDITNSGGFNSAFEQVKNMLYTSTGYNENITISALPIYYLEPNTLVSVYDTESSIQGNYMIKTISLPLAINGTMNLSCSKAIEKF